MEIPSLKAIRLYEQVAATIRESIVRGELSVGERLPTEREIANIYSVSRNVVREAVRALANDGLLEVRQGSGTYVTDGTSKALGNSLQLAISVSDAADKLVHLIEVRQLVEPGVAALAAERATEQDIATLRHEVDLMDSAAGDVEAFIAADHRFHVAIAKASDNPLVALMLNPIVDLLHEQRKRLFFLEHSASSAQEFHHKILAAIERRNSRVAYSTMRAHLEQVTADINRLPRQKASTPSGGAARRKLRSGR